MTKMNCLRVFVPSWRGFAIVWLAICFWPAPAAAVDREHQQLEADIRMLQEQAQQLQQMLSGLGDALKQLNTRIDDVIGVIMIVGTTIATSTVACAG